MILYNWDTQLWILLDIIIACTLTGLIGYEREADNKPAGFRTQMIIGGASAFLVALSEVAVQYYTKSYGDVVDADPARIMQAIIIGISFVGAGTIIKAREDTTVRYLTTATTILFSAGVGIAVSLKQYILAVGVVLIVLFINRGLRSLK
uniref:MgtC/SapB family protein n=1 Tax=Roseihalotalea indica TaxID=2867963 RepID=A0AA49GTQ6_9BACT|nr:MgtC/SapB family protein [Tunicatimonas sp. TK19036]